MGVGVDGGRLYLLVGGVLLAELDVLVDGRAEQNGLLVDDTDVRAQPAQVERLDFLAVDKDRAARRIVEALQQLHTRRLAASAAAHERYGRARLDLETQRVEYGHFGSRRILETNVPELDFADQVVRLVAFARERIDL